MCKVNQHQRNDVKHLVSSKFYATLYVFSIVTFCSIVPEIFMFFIRAYITFSFQSVIKIWLHKFYNLDLNLVHKALAFKNTTQILGCTNTE